ncbi:MAG: hypothetical protein K9J30_06430 [Bacteroidales bacterium]|nr:hypothetical protein [Bacteroidales bacterium]
MTRTMVLLLVLLMITGCMETESEIIRKSLGTKLEMYPASTLKDLYKSYFQDYFGPGHLISDTASAGRYLDYELSQDDYIDSVLIEPTGYEGNFYRVNLSLIKDNIIPRDTFFRYFIESVNSVEGISHAEWIEKWGMILGEIEHVAQTLDGYGSDREFIDSLLQNGEYVVHHSKRYIRSYHPHYRIIHSQIFDEHLAGYLE